MSCDNCMKRRTFLSRAAAFPAAVVAMIIGQGATSALARALFKKPPRPDISADEVKKLSPGEPKHFPNSGAWILLSDDKSLAAFDQKCTHKGCAFTWSAKNNRFECPCHGSAFAVTGKVLNGPATKPLAQLKIEKTKDGGIKLTG